MSSSNDTAAVSDLPRVFDLRMETATGPVRGKIAVPSGPMRLAELVPLAWELTAIQLREATRKLEAESRSIRCGAKCGACCRQLVPLSAPEVFHLGEYVASQPEERRSLWLSGFDRAIRALGESGLRGPLSDPRRNPDDEMAIAAAYFRLALPCPFLENESCGIHSDRPVACREFNVTSEPELCADPIHNPIERVSLPTPLSDALARLTCELTGLEIKLIPLTLAPVWAGAHAELDRRTWPGPDLFRRFMALAGGAAEAEGPSGETADASASGAGD